jgi:hypothetical protein
MHVLSLGEHLKKKGERQAHEVEHIIQSGRVADYDVFVGGVASLTCMPNVGSMGDALKVFNKLRSRDVVTWGPP